METKLSIGAKLRSARHEAGMTQQEAAAVIGIDRGYLSRLEAGKINITIEVMCRYLDAVKAEIAISQEES